MAYRAAIGRRAYVFPDLKALLARASPIRSGDQLAGVAAASLEEMMAARIALADVPLSDFLQDVFVPYDEDEVTRLILRLSDRVGSKQGTTCLMHLPGAACAELPKRRQHIVSHPAFECFRLWPLAAQRQAVEACFVDVDFVRLLI